MSTRDSSGSDGDARAMSWSAVRKWLKKSGAVVPVTVLSGLLQVLASVTGVSTPRVRALVIVALGCLWACRFLTHLGLNYWTWQPWRQEQRLARALLDLLVVADAAVVLGMTAVGVWTFLDPVGGHVQSILAATCAVCLLVVALGTVDAAVSLGLPRASEAGADLPIVHFIRRLLGHATEVPGLGFLSRVWGTITPVDKVSGFTNWILVGLVTVPTVGTIPHLYPLFPSRTVEAGSTARTSPPASPLKDPPSSITTVVVSRVTTVSVPSDIPDSDGSYTAQCGTQVTPGEGAPEPQKAGLASLWVGGPGRDGAGAVQAGCAQLARPVADHPGVYYALGVCEGEIRSLGVASLDRRAELLYQEAAVFAKNLAQAGQLLGASERTRAGNGDFQVVYAEPGSFVMIRARTSAGQVTPDPELAPCARVKDENVKYVVVPPGLVGPWFDLVRDRGQWIWPTYDRSVHATGDFVFRADDGAGTVIAHGSCTNLVLCSVTSRGRVFRTGTLLVTAETLEPYAPAPAK